MGQPGVAVLQLLGAELLDGVVQRLLVGAELVCLLGVVLVDHLLDRDRAGHGGTLAEQGGADAEREAGDVPERLQRGRTHAALGDQPLEGLQVAQLLLVHVADRRALGPVAEHRELTFVDPPGAVFAGMVDADHALDQRRGLQVARQPAFAGAPRASVAASLCGLAHGSSFRPMRPTTQNEAAASSSEAMVL